MKRFISLFIVVAASVHAQSNYEPYYFGSFVGIPGYGAVDGTGTTARFQELSGVAVDSTGNVFVADTSNHVIRKVTPAGVVSTWAGSFGNQGRADGTGSGAQFNLPRGIAVDAAGFVYVASQDNTIRKITPGGTVTTLAGSALSSGSADGTGSAARFNFPQALTVDSAGNLYVSDTHNHTIRKVTAAGVVTTLAGLARSSGSVDGTGSAARFNNPNGIGVDSTGNIYVADQTNCTIRKITSAGVVSTFAGVAGAFGASNGTGSTARFWYPFGLAVDGAGNIFVADQVNNLIRKITPGATVTSVAGSVNGQGSADGTGASARFYNPNGIAVDANGYLYVADGRNYRIRKITPAGTTSILAGADSPGVADGTRATARVFRPFGVAVDANANVYVADTENHTIRKVTAAGVVSTLAGNPGFFGSANGTGAAARFTGPQGVAADAAGYVYVADTTNQIIRKITPDGTVTTLAGSPNASGSQDGVGAAARFFYPQGIAVDAGANIYVADTNNNTIRKITPAGVVTTIAGMAGSSGSADGAGSTARFNSPAGVAVDSSGNIFVADQYNSTIRKITPDAVVTTIAGTADQGGDADGIGTAARFQIPTGMAVDSAGNLYVTETGNLGVRKITPGLIVTTLGGATGYQSFTNGIGSSARFGWPTAICVDSAGTLYVADALNDEIRFGELPLTTTSAVSRKTHNSAGVFDILLPLSGPVGVESRSGGASGNHSLVIALNHPIADGNAAVTGGSGAVAGAPMISGSSISVDLTGVTDAQQVTLALNNVTDALGQPLPATNVSAGFLVGDANGEGTVNSADATLTQNRSGQATDATTFRADFNLDGAINAADATIVRARSGRFIPSALLLRSASRNSDR